VTYERKMREMNLSARLEQTLSKDQILELYLNSPIWGRPLGRRHGGAQLLRQAGAVG